MEAKNNKKAVYDCHQCAGKFNLPLGHKLRVTCPHCAAKLEINTKPKAFPSIISACSAALGWCVCVVPLTGTQFGTYAALIVSLAAWLLTRSAAEKWFSAKYDTSVLAAISRLFKIMTFVAIPFVALSVFAREITTSWLAQSTIGQILIMQDQLSRFNFSKHVGAFSGSVGLGFALFAVAYYLDHNSDRMKKLVNIKEKIGKFFGTVTTIILCAGSFSIVTGASSFSLIQLTTEQIREELKATYKDLSRIREGVIIVLGERFAAEILDADKPDQLAPSGANHTKCDHGVASVPECDLESLSTGLQAITLLTASYQSSDTPTFDKEVSALETGLNASESRRSKSISNADLKSYSSYTPNEVHAAADAFCESTECARPKAKGSLHTFVELTFDSVIELSGVSLPKVDISGKIGSFANAVSSTASQDQLKKTVLDAVKENITTIIKKCSRGICSVNVTLPAGTKAATTSLRPYANDLEKQLALQLGLARQALTRQQKDRKVARRGAEKRNMGGITVNPLSPNTDAVGGKGICRCYKEPGHIPCGQWIVSSEKECRAGH